MTDIYGAPCLPSIGEPCGSCHRCADQLCKFDGEQRPCIHDKFPELFCGCGCGNPVGDS